MAAQRQEMCAPTIYCAHKYVQRQLIDDGEFITTHQINQELLFLLITDQMTCKWHNTSSDDSINLIFNSKTAGFNTQCEEVFLIHDLHTNSVTHTGFSFNSGFFSLQHKTSNLLKLMCFFCCTSFGLFFQNGELLKALHALMLHYEDLSLGLTPIPLLLLINYVCKTPKLEGHLI